MVRGNSTAPVFIKPGQPTLASVLKAAGYRTACIGKWGIGTPDNFTNPNDVGFGHFFGYVNMWHAHNFYPEFLIRNGAVVKLKNVVAQKGLTIVPLKAYFKRGIAKIEFATARGKKMYQKKEALKIKDLDREAKREMRER